MAVTSFVLGHVGSSGGRGGGRVEMGREEERVGGGGGEGRVTDDRRQCEQPNDGMREEDDKCISVKKGRLSAN